MAQSTGIAQGAVVGKGDADDKLWFKVQARPTSLQAAAYGRDPEAGGAASPPRNVQKGQKQCAGLDVLQLACKDSSLPPSVRLDFVKKVYGILSLMLLVTFGLASPFVFATEATTAWFANHMWVFLLVLALLVVQYAFTMCMVCQMCCGGSSLSGVYLRMFKTVPWNFIYLFTFAACFGVVVGIICAQYTAESVLLVFGLTVVMVIALTVYAVRTQADFTGCGAYVVVFFVGLILTSFMTIFLPHNHFMHNILAGCGAMFFGFIIAYDTELIFGSASKSFGGGARAVEYTVDMYAFAAFNVYVDFINFFVHLLECLGVRN